MVERHLYGGVCRKRRDWAVSIFQFSLGMRGDGCYSLAHLFSYCLTQFQKFLNYARMKDCKLTNQTVEEMDLVFGSEGVGRGDLERMEAVRREVGLDRILGESSSNGDVSPMKENKSEQAEKIHEM